MTPDELDQTLTVLRKHGVTSATVGGLVVVFAPPPHQRQLDRDDRETPRRALSLGERILAEHGHGDT